LFIGLSQLQIVLPTIPKSSVFKNSLLYLAVFHFYKPFLSRRDMQWAELTIKIVIEVLKWAYDETKEKRRKKHDSKSK
jgi:hypothetical protein